MGDISNSRENGRAVVVVEDDAELAAIICDVYETLGAKCLALSSFGEVQRAARRVLASDLVVLDINLGDGRPSGVDVWHWLRRRRYAGRVAFLTGHAVTNPLVKSAAALAAAPILNKPVSMETLAGLLPRAVPEAGARSDRP